MGRRSGSVWSSGSSGKTRSALGRGGSLRLQRFAPALCPLSAAWGSGSSGGGGRRQPRRRRPRLERRLKREPNRRGVRPLVVGGLPPFGAARRGDTAAPGSRWGPCPDPGGEKGKGRAASSVPGPRLRLYSPHLNQEAAESEAPLLRPFLCVGPGVKEGTNQEGRGAVPFAVRGLGAAGALGRPGAWGALHRDPLGFFLAPLSAFLCLFFSFSPLLWFRAFLPSPSSPSVPFQGITMPPARPRPLLAPPPFSLPPFTFPSSPHYPALTVQFFSPSVFARSCLFAWIKIKNIGCRRLGANGEERWRKEDGVQLPQGAACRFVSLPRGWRFSLFHHHLPTVKDFFRSDAEWLFQSQVANLGVVSDRFVLFLGPP